MAVKCTGAEFLQFYNDKAWWFSEEDGNLKPGEEHTYWEDATILVNGKSTDEYEFDYEAGIKPTDTISVVGGCVMGKVVGKPDPSVESYFKRWRNAQQNTMVVIDCPKDKLDAILEAVKVAGGSVRK